MDKILKALKVFFGGDLVATLALCFLFILTITGFGYLIAPKLASNQAKSQLTKDRGAKEADILDRANKLRNYLPLFLALVGLIITVMLVVGRVL